MFRQTIENGVKVNWGDGSTPQKYTGVNTNLTITHQYEPTSYPASYEITFEVISGTMSFPTRIMGISTQNTASPKDAFLSMIDEVNIGNGVTSIGTLVF